MDQPERSPKQQVIADLRAKAASYRDDARKLREDTTLADVAHLAKAYRMTADELERTAAAL